MQGSLVDAVGVLLLTGHAKALSRKSEQASAEQAPVSRDRMGWVTSIVYSRCGRIKIVYKERKLLEIGTVKDRFRKVFVDSRMERESEH